jgi:hypothetical protein
MPNARVHRVALSYDDSGHAVEEAYFDTDGKPIVGTSVVHRIARKFDGHGNITEFPTLTSGENPHRSLEGTGPYPSMAAANL